MGIPVGKAIGVGSHIPKAEYAQDLFGGTTAVNGTYIYRPGACEGFWPVYAGFYDEHTAMSNSVAIRAGYRKPGGSLTQAVFVGATADVTLAPGAFEHFYVPGPFTDDDLVEIRSHGAQAAGKIPMGRVTDATADEGVEFGSPATDKSASGTIDANNLFGFGPAFLIGDRPVNPKYKSVLVRGNSLADGQNNASERQSYAVIAMENANPPVPYIHGAHSGARAVITAGSPALMTALSAHVHRVIAEEAVNDFRFGATWQQVAAAQITLADIAVAQGAEGTHLFTCTPDNTNGGGLPTFEADRLAYNAWVRAGSPMLSGAPVAPGTGGARVLGDTGHPFLVPFEAADRAETHRDSGFFREGYSNDDIHLDGTVKHAAVGRSVDPRVFLTNPPAHGSGNAQLIARRRALAAV